MAVVAARRPTPGAYRCLARNRTSAAVLRISRRRRRGTVLAVKVGAPVLRNHDRAHNGRLTRGRIPADIVDGATKMRAAR
jgi:hypothetical protein